MASPKLTEIKKLLETGGSFSLTNTQYKDTTGLDLPKDNYYLTHKSAVARCAKEHGFRVVIQERQITFERIDENEQSNE